MKLFKKAKKGFTLVELVVVIAVIAILAGVSVGAYFGITESANQSKADQEAKQVHTALLVIANDPKVTDITLDGAGKLTYNEATLEAQLLTQLQYKIDVITTTDSEVDNDAKASLTFTDDNTAFTYKVVNGKSSSLVIKTGAAA